MASIINQFYFIREYMIDLQKYLHFGDTTLADTKSDSDVENKEEEKAEEICSAGQEWIKIPAEDNNIDNNIPVHSVKYPILN